MAVGGSPLPDPFPGDRGMPGRARQGQRFPREARTTVRVGDRVEAFVGRQRVLEVVRVIDTRVGAPIAAACVVDQSPPPQEERSTGLVRAPGDGRPTKRDRRQMDRLRSR